MWVTTYLGVAGIAAGAGAGAPRPPAAPLRLHTAGFPLMCVRHRFPPPLPTRMLAFTTVPALGWGVAVHEIMYYASSGASEAGNPTPLTLGALAYLVIFLPVVVFSRWIETRFAWKR